MQPSAIGNDRADRQPAGTTENENATSKITLVALALLLGSVLFGAAQPITPTMDYPDRPVLACKSLDFYKRFADFDLNAKTIQDFYKRFWNELREISDNCGEFLYDGDDPNLYHVERTDLGYVCVQATYAKRCRWTTASKLQHIGHGPQLTDKQYAEVRRLHAVSDAFRMVNKEYWKQVDEIIYINDKNSVRRVLTTAQEREVAELGGLAEKADDQAIELEKKADKIVPLKAK
jgi:hypothetical protein